MQRRAPGAPHSRAIAPKRARARGAEPAAPLLAQAPRAPRPLPPPRAATTAVARAGVLAPRAA
jgi:hypothetical protein